ncbi:hypothetical protein ACFY7C_36480 [Streptomyces sp. NPDC012769]|uniref:hypothetical protein n=1 Tax=Streptomyces sp. NPDC012769 TaxID=3364848 RepID=UPI0036BDE1EA
MNSWSSGSRKTMPTFRRISVVCFSPTSSLELREEAEQVLAELAKAEAVLERWAIARVEPAEALSGPESEAGHPPELVSAKVEGVRSKLKRLVERGWLAEERPGVFMPRRAAG